MQKPTHFEWAFCCREFSLALAGNAVIRFAQDHYASEYHVRKRVALSPNGNGGPPKWSVR
jgi:hypothetical protein